MNYEFNVIVEADYACFTRPEMKVERVSYEVPTPGALEGMLKNIYWKPAIRYVIKKIVVFNPINYMNVSRNEVKKKTSMRKIKSLMNGNDVDPCTYTCTLEERTQRSSLILKNVKYGITFTFEPTGLRCDEEIGENQNQKSKHYHIIENRLKKGRYFRMPYLGCREFSIKKLEMVDKFDYSQISDEIAQLGDVDLGFMNYEVQFENKGIPDNGDWVNPVFSNKAKTLYYNPHMINGVIDVEKYYSNLNTTEFPLP